MITSMMKIRCYRLKTQKQSNHPKSYKKLQNVQNSSSICFVRFFHDYFMSFQNKREFFISNLLKQYYTINKRDWNGVCFLLLFLKMDEGV